MKAHLFFLVLTAAFTATPYGQTRPVLDVSVTSLEATKSGKVATLHVQNNSGKDVAAFNVALTVRHSDGTTTQTGAMTDFGYRATREGDQKKGIPKLLVAGESYEDRVVLDSDVVDVTPKLAAVVYADRTAHGDADSVNEIVHSRKKYAERVAKENPKDAGAAASYAKDDVRRDQ